MSNSAEERIAAFTQAVAQADQNKDRLDLMQEEIKAIEAVETSPDRSVTVTTGASGSVKSIKITEAAMSKSAQALSQLVHRTLQLGMAKSARMQAEIIQKYVGDSSQIVEKVNKLQEDLLNPETSDGFQIHRDSPGDEDSVLVSSDRPAPPRPPAPASYPAPNQPQPPSGFPPAAPPSAPRPAPQRPAVQRPRADHYDDYDSAPGVLTDSGSRSRPQPASPPPASRRNDDEVFRFGEEDY